MIWRRLRRSGRPCRGSARPAADRALSSRLSRISACGSLASPWMTLIRSYTTRRSAPITRSRLRRPTSKSTTTTVLAALRERCAERRCGCGLADAALARCDHYHLGHTSYSSFDAVSAAIGIASPSSQAWTGLPRSAWRPCPRRSGRGRRSRSARLRACGRRCAPAVAVAVPAMARPRSAP